MSDLNDYDPMAEMDKFDRDEPKSEEMATPDERKSDLTDLQKAFRERNKASKKDFEQRTDSEYWFCVCFQSREEKEELLRLLGWSDLGDKYLDGLKVAEREGINLESKSPKMRNAAASKTWREFLMQ